MAFPKSKYSKLPGDSILALLEPGEYVLNRNAVDDIGEEKLDELNFEDSPRFKMNDKTKTFQKKLIEKYLHGKFDESNDKGYWWESLPENESNDKGFELPIKDESNDRGFELNIINPTGLTLGGMLGDMIGMQTGGSISYGGVTSSVPTFPQLYEEMDLAPKPGTERTEFESKFQYDPEREGIVFEDYSRAVSDATRTSQDKLYSQLMGQQAGAAKSGFAGAGGGAAQARGRDTLMGDFMSQQAAAQSTLFKGIQGERDAWMREAGQGLSTLDSQEGTIPFSEFGNETFDPGEQSETLTVDHSNAPSNPSVGDTYTNSNGNTYKWTSFNTWLPTSG